MSGTKSIVAVAGFDEETLNSSNSGSTASLPSVVSSGGAFDHVLSSRYHQGPPPPHQQPPAQNAPLAGQLALFSRELVDLLKAQPGCRMPFHKFIPSYHHFFGRQCRQVLCLTSCLFVFQRRAALAFI